MRRASRGLRALYCLALLSWIFPGMVVGASGWIGLATGGLLLAPLVLAAVLAFVLHRVYQVIRYPDALDADLASAAIRIVRGLGVGAMAIGTASALGMFAIPLVARIAFGGQRSESGVEFFIVGLVLWALSNLSALGWLLFELSRVIATPRAMLPSLRTLAGLAVAGLAVGALSYGLLEFAERKDRSACAPQRTLASCVAEPRRAIVRQVTAGDPAEVAFDSTVRSIEYRKAGLLRDGPVLHTESPATSLAAAGLKPAAGEARIRVSIRAEEQAGGVRVRAEVFEGGERTAWLEHLAPAGARLQGNDRIVYVIEEPAVSLRTMLSRTDDAGMHAAHTLDEIFLFLRAAIRQPLEAALEARTVDVADPARLDSALAVPAPVESGEIDRQKDGAKESWNRCREIIDIYKEAPAHGGSSPRDIARLRQLHFKQTDAVPEVYHPHDRLVCDSAGVFATGHDRADSRVRIRRYDLEGNPVYSLRVKLPVLEATEAGRSILALQTLEEEGGELRFERRVWDTPKGQVRFVRAERFSVPIPGPR